jgi:hypothetical protein
MADVKKPESVWVMPVKGKYCEIVFDNRAFKIWKVHPGSPDRFGTQIPYAAAVYFLGKVPPIITLVPEIKDGKHVSPLLEEDVRKIQDSLDQGFVGGFKNYNDVSKTDPVGAAGSDEALKQALALLAQQSEANRGLQDAVLKLQERLSRVEVGSTGRKGSTGAPEGSGGGSYAPGTGTV